jgi:hypothetical protein
VGRFSATTCGKIFSILIVQDTINLAGQMQPFSFLYLPSKKQASYLANMEIARKCGKDSSNHKNSTFNVLYIEISATCYNQRYKGAFPLALSFFSISSRPPAP